MKPTVLCLAVVTTLVAGAAAAHAQAPGQTPADVAAAPTTTVTEHYGYQIAIADGLAIGASAATENSAPLMLYVLGGPIIHWVHGQGGTAFVSLGLRVGLPYLGAAIAWQSVESRCQADTDNWFCGMGEVFLGAAAGAITASLLDYFWLARKTTTVHREALFQVGSVRANPNLGVTRGGVNLGLAGTF